MQGEDTRNADRGVGFGEAIGAGFKKYATLSGRSSRSEFWYWTLYYFLCLAAILAAGTLAGEDLVWIGYVVFALLNFMPSLAVTVRRLHDIDRSGWWYLLIFVPIIGPFAAILLIAWFTIRGTVGENRFGPDPLAVRMTEAA